MMIVLKDRQGYQEMKRKAQNGSAWKLPFFETYQLTGQTK